MSMLVAEEVDRLQFAVALLVSKALLLLELEVEHWEWVVALESVVGSARRFQVLVSMTSGE